MGWASFHAQVPSFSFQECYDGLHPCDGATDCFDAFFVAGNLGLSGLVVVFNWGFAWIRLGAKQRLHVPGTYFKRPRFFTFPVHLQ